MTAPAPADTRGRLSEPQVRAMFDRIARVYDLMNSVMTAGMHHRWRERAAKTKLWIVYPKAQAKRKPDTGLTQFLIREGALAVGLVDYKICSVNETWTALLFTLKK